MKFKILQTIKSLKSVEFVLVLKGVIRTIYKGIYSIDKSGEVYDQFFKYKNVFNTKFIVR